MLRSLRVLVNGSTFWGGLAVDNFTLLAAQPAVLILSGMLVATVYAVLWIGGWAGSGGGRLALGWLVRAALWYLAFCITWMPVLIPVGAVAGGGPGPPAPRPTG